MNGRATRAIEWSDSRPFSLDVCLLTDKSSVVLG